MEKLINMRRIHLGVFSLFAIFIQELSALRCYECNPSAGFGISSSSYASGSGGAFGSSSASSTDCYSPDSRQIKDCAWDIQSCYMVVLPGPQSTSIASGGTPNSPAAGTSLATSNQAQIVGRGCGRSPLARPSEVGDDECKVVTITPPYGVQQAIPVRATICNCKSSQCNDKRPDQLPSAGFSSSPNTGWTSMSGSAPWISPWGSGTPYPGMNRDSSSGYGSPYNADGAVLGQATSYSNNNNQSPNMYFHPNNPPFAQQTPSGYYVPQNARSNYNSNNNAFAIDARDTPIGGAPYATQNVASTAYGPSSTLYSNNHLQAPSGFVSSADMESSNNNYNNRNVNNYASPPATGNNLGFANNPNSGGFYPNPVNTNRQMDGASASSSNAGTSDRRDLLRPSSSSSLDYSSNGQRQAPANVDPWRPNSVPTNGGTIEYYTATREDKYDGRNGSIGRTDRSALLVIVLVTMLVWLRF